MKFLFLFIVLNSTAFAGNPIDCYFNKRELKNNNAEIIKSQKRIEAILSNPLVIERQKVSEERLRIADEELDDIDEINRIMSTYESDLELEKKTTPLLEEAWSLQNRIASLKSENSLIQPLINGYCN